MYHTKPSTLLTVYSEVVASCLKPLKKPVPKQKMINTIARRTRLTASSLQKISVTNNLQIKSGLTITSSIRRAHTDIKVPDFSDYRTNGTKSPKSRSSDDGKLLGYGVAALFGITGAYGVKSSAIHYVMSMAASADVLALAKIEVNLSDIPEGKNATFKWRGKPLYVKHRTSTEIETEQAVDISTLRDPEADSDRAPNPAWLVVLGVCTHLGCVPIPNSGDYEGGYYCPCHGSHYDACGRIRKGPAPSNLEVPQNKFVGDNILVVG